MSDNNLRGKIQGSGGRCICNISFRSKERERERRQRERRRRRKVEFGETDRIMQNINMFIISVLFL